MNTSTAAQRKSDRTPSGVRATSLNVYLCRIVSVVMSLVTAADSFAQQQWFWKNPLPQGNGLRGLFAIDANILCAVGDFGAILKTTDGGSSWLAQPSRTTIHLKGVWFTDANRGIVVGDSGTILRTTDGGTSWTMETISPTITFYAVCFTDANTGTAVGYPGAIYRTTNGGTTWTPQIGPPGICISAVSFTDANTGTIVGSYGAIYRTTNGGSKWNRQVSGLEGTIAPLLSGVSFSDANIGTAVGESGTILRTTDGGDTWNIQASGTAFGLRAVHFLDANIGTVAGDVGLILHTTDGGATWTEQSYGSTWWFSAVQFTTAETGTVVGSHGVVYRTDDGGTSWRLQTPGPRTELYGVRFADAATGIAVGYGGVILRTSDGGGTWVPQPSPTQENLNGVAFANAAVGAAVGDHGAILRTTDGGASWIDETIPSSKKEVLWLFSVSFGSPSRGIITARLDTLIIPDPPLWDDRSIILQTTDGGMSWFRGPLKRRNWFYAVCFEDSLHATAVGDTGMIIHTTDGGREWIEQNGMWDLENYIRPVTTVRLFDVSFSGLDHGTVVGDSGVILQTFDGGTTWALQASGTTRRLNGVWMLDSLNAVAVGDSATVLRTSDGGTTWNTQEVWTYDPFYAVSSTGIDRVTVAGQGGAILSSISQGIPLSVGGGRSSLPLLEFSLLQNYPNPFNGMTNLEYRIADRGFVSVKVFDILGRQVATLVDDEKLPGVYRVQWNAANFASGVYFCRMQAGNFIQTRKVLLLR
jgi:photosystem II stability/assembly factor-like uncharacterized protein